MFYHIGYIHCTVPPMCSIRGGDEGNERKQHVCFTTPSHRPYTSTEPYLPCVHPAPATGGVPICAEGCMRQAAPQQVATLRSRLEDDRLRDNLGGGLKSIGWTRLHNVSTDGCNIVLKLVDLCTGVTACTDECGDTYASSRDYCGKNHPTRFADSVPPNVYARF